MKEEKTFLKSRPFYLGCDCADAKERARLSKRIYYIKHGRHGKSKDKTKSLYRVCDINNNQI
jgi:hypothetical protein